MYVIATAGHVDHGKSTLVRALTGMEPDRWAEEKRRGLTIDLGFAWTTLPSGREVAFVDVPGHEKFLANMLAGVGPAPIVCLVVAADQGWQAQSTDHRDAITALGIRRGLVVITRADLAQETVAATRAQVQRELAGTALAQAPVVEVSAVTGQGMDHLVAALDAVTEQAPAPDAQARVRLWIDRDFTIKGAGTVVTGTLTAGTLRAGDRLELLGHSARTLTGVRGLQSRNAAAESVGPAARVAVNLRDVPAEAIHRGDALLTPEAWCVVDTVDVRRTMGQALDAGVQELTFHLGTAAVQARVRPLGPEAARLSLERALPLQLGDRAVLRAPGSRNVYAGIEVLDVDPPQLRRRGAGARRAAELATRPAGGDVAAEVARRGAVREAVLLRFGLRIPEALPDVARLGPWLVSPAALAGWVPAAQACVKEQLAAQPMAPGVPVRVVAAALGSGASEVPGLPAEASELVAQVLGRAGLEQADGLVRPPGHTANLGAAEAGVAELERRLAAEPFAAPEADELRALRLGARELAVAERAGRLLRLAEGLVVAPRTPAQAMRVLSGLEQPFTTSQARQALGTSRRVVIPLLEHLDARGWTRRVDAAHREVRR